VAAAIERGELARQILDVHAGTPIDVGRIFVRQHSDVHAR
jgi:hypothetical protein